MKATILLLLVASASRVTAVTFEPVSDPVYWPVNGHYYQDWRVRCDMSSSWSWEDIDEYASSLRIDDHIGYLATVTSFAEQEFLVTGGLKGGLVGAARFGDEYVWIRGPLDELGERFHNFGGGLDCPLIPCSCAPCDRLLISDWCAYARGSVGGYCGVYSCLERYFLVEFGGVVRQRDSAAFPDAEAPSSVERDTWGRVKAFYAMRPKQAP